MYYIFNKSRVDAQTEVSRERKISLFTSIIINYNFSDSLERNDIIVYLTCIQSYEILSCTNVRYSILASVLGELS